MPFIDVVVVGPVGAGKSCLLAAMNHGLEQWDPAPAPSVRPAPVTALALAETWRSMRSGGPPGAGSDALVDLWFEAVAEDGAPLFEIRLADVDGKLAAAGERTGRALAGRVRAADALLVVLDGQGVARLLDGDRDGFDRDMAWVWKLLATRGKAVRFVVTKWDLLRDRVSLSGVREALSAVPGFAAALRRASTRSDGAGSTALIPVSVLGEDAGGQAVVPLLSVLPQVLRAAADHPGRSRGRGGALVAGVGANWLSQAVTAVAVRQLLQRLVDTVPERRAARRCAGHAAVGVSMLVEAAVRTWCDRTARLADGEVTRADGKALTRAADAYEWQLREFRRRFPESDLTGEPSPGPRLLRRLIG